jgi:hypothetical protein
MDGGAAEAVVVGATWVIDKVWNNSGDVEWQLDLMKGKKHVRNDPANEGTGAYQDQTINIRGPRASTFLGLDKIYFDCDVQFQYNGSSIANITVLPRSTSDAAGAGLKVEAKIQEDDKVYLDNQRRRIAGMKVHITYRFTSPLYDDLLAKSELSVYGDGDFRFKHEWTQD